MVTLLGCNSSQIGDTNVKVKVFLNEESDEEIEIGQTTTLFAHWRDILSFQIANGSESKELSNMKSSISVKDLLKKQSKTFQQSLELLASQNQNGFNQESQQPQQQQQITLLLEFEIQRMSALTSQRSSTSSLVKDLGKDSGEEQDDNIAHIGSYQNEIIQENIIDENTFSFSPTKQQHKQGLQEEIGQGKQGEQDKFQFIRMYTEEEGGGELNQQNQFLEEKKDQKEEGEKELAGFTVQKDGEQEIDEGQNYENNRNYLNRNQWQQENNLDKDINEVKNVALMVEEANYDKDYDISQFFEDKKSLKHNEEKPSRRNTNPDNTNVCKRNNSAQIIKNQYSKIDNNNSDKDIKNNAARLAKLKIIENELSHLSQLIKKKELQFSKDTKNTHKMEQIHEMNKLLAVITSQLKDIQKHPCSHCEQQYLPAVQAGLIKLEKRYQNITENKSNVMQIQNNIIQSDKQQKLAQSSGIPRNTSKTVLTRQTKEQSLKSQKLLPKKNDFSKNINKSSMNNLHVNQSLSSFSVVEKEMEIVRELEQENKRLKLRNFVLEGDLKNLSKRVGQEKLSAAQRTSFKIQDFREVFEYFLSLRDERHQLLQEIEQLKELKESKMSQKDKQLIATKEYNLKSFAQTMKEYDIQQKDVQAAVFADETMINKELALFKKKQLASHLNSEYSRHQHMEISFEENENNYEDEEYEIRNQTDIKEEEIDKLLDQRKSVIAELFQRFNQL